MRWLITASTRTGSPCQDPLPLLILHTDAARKDSSDKVVHIIAATSPDPVAMPAGITWTRDYWQALHPHSAGGAYVNFLMDEGQDPVRATYGANMDRLVELKSKYDPTNLFWLNQNTKPTV